MALTPHGRQFEAYCELIGMTQQMEIAAAHVGPIDLSGMTDVNLRLTKSLYALLVSSTESRAIALVRFTPTKNGLEAWRLLKKEYEAHGGAITAAMLRGILNPRHRWEHMNNQGKDINELLQMRERDVAHYKIATGSDIDGAILVAIVL